MDLAPLRQLCNELDVNDRVQWKVGYASERQVSELFRSASVLALPYREIDQSGVLMTAVAFHKPVVATRVGAIPETIQHGVHGYLVEPGDVDGFARSLEAVLSDEQRRSAMQAAMRDLCQGSLSWDGIARQTLQMYGQLTDRHAIANAA
jgi:glycosyltransferase involved in cell wall biosynthesis